MKASDIENLFSQAGLSEMTIQYYLQGMVISATAKKP